MSDEPKTVQWLEKFTGLAITGQAKGADPEQAALTFAREKAEKQRLLAGARRVMGEVKGALSKAMEQEVSVQSDSLRDRLFGQKMLVTDGTSVDEADFEDIEFGKIKFSAQASEAMRKGTAAITGQAELLKNARIEREGKLGALFTPEELQREFWTPLMRERILPETFIPNVYSEVQSMNDATMKEYRSGIAEKKKAGQLTEETSGKRMLVDAGADLANLAGSAALLFAPGSADAKLASSVLKGAGQLLTSGSAVYDSATAKKYGEASDSALSGGITILGLILGNTAMAPGTIKAIQDGLKASAAASKAGRQFAQGTKEGVLAGVETLGGVLASAVSAGADVDTDPKGTAALKVAAASLPAVFVSGVIAAGMVEKVQDNDTAGMVELLIKGVKTSVTVAGNLYPAAVSLDQAVKNGDQAPEVETDPEVIKEEAAQKVFEGEMASRESDEQDELVKKVGEEATDLKKEIVDKKKDPSAPVKMALVMAQGKLLQGLNAVIDAIASGLVQSLETAGLSLKLATSVGAVYGGKTSAAKAFASLQANPPKVAEAVQVLAQGIEAALAAAAPGNPGLAKAGSALSKAVAGLAGGIKLEKFYDDGKYVEGVEFFSQTLLQRVQGVLKIGQGVAVAEGTEGAESGQMAGLLKEVGAQAAASAKELEAGVEKLEKEEARVELEAMIKEEADELKLMQNEAADIDKLIAKMESDRNWAKIAVQLSSGGAAFAASFIPLLGSVSAGIKMAASMVAAGLRAQRLYQWSQNQQDFAAAQSVLTAASQNFVKNQRDQFAQYTVAALFQGAQMIGNASKITGITAPISQGIEVAGKIGEAANELLHKYKKKYDLEGAWQLTKRSFQNPTNRKLGLRARQQNPTLAKYCLAWGAIEKKDALARKAVQVCGLTEAVLESESANLGKVKDYLESYYEDDDKLYRDLEADADWIPADLTLTLRSWIGVKTLAATNIGLEGAGTGAVEGCLAQIKTPVAKLKLDEIEPRLAALAELDRVLSKYVPVTKEDSGKKTMAGIVKLYRSRISAQCTAVEARRDKLKVAKATPPDPEARKKLLADAAALAGELQLQLGQIATFTFDDELDDMLEASDAAEALLKEVTGELRKDPKVEAAYHELCQAQCEFLIRIRYKTQDEA